MKWPLPKHSHPRLEEEIQNLKDRLPSQNMHNISELVIKHYDLKKPSILYQKWLEDKVLRNIMDAIDKHIAVPDSIRKEQADFVARMEEKLASHRENEKKLYAAIAALFGKQSFAEVMEEVKAKDASVS